MEKVHFQCYFFNVVHLVVDIADDNTAQKTSLIERNLWWDEEKQGKAGKKNLKL